MRGTSHLLPPAALLVALLCPAASTAAGVDIARAKKQREGFHATLVKKILEAKGDPNCSPCIYALAALYDGTDIQGANEKMLADWQQAVGEKGEMTTRGAVSIKWRMRTWLRIYYLFHDKSAFFPGRLNKEVQAKMEEAFFLYGSGKSTLHRAEPEYIWFIQGSENHDLMDLSNAYLALQAVQNLPGYKDRKLPDGHTPAEHVKAWEKYYALYPLERAKNGLFVEISPTYGKWFVGEFVNMADFADSDLVRKRMEMLLHLMWADWSVDLMGEVRGGGRTRCYQGLYSQAGGMDSWDQMGRLLAGIDGSYGINAAIQSQLIFTTSHYALPEVILKIALGKQDDAPFVYRSTRPAKLVGKPKGGPREKGYWMDGTGGRMLRYTFHTPDYAMGSWMLDSRVNYAAINTQNRWQGVIFPTNRNARVYPQSLGLGNGKTYNQHIAAQHRNVMIVMTHPKAKQTGQMRVFFPTEMAGRVVEKDGWVILKEGAAWLGVRFLDGKDGRYKWQERRERTPKEGSRRDSDCKWLRPVEEKPSVVFVTSRESLHKTTDDFFAYLAAHSMTSKKGGVTCTFTDDRGEETTLALGGALPVPKINGAVVDLTPEKVFDSPYLQADHGSGVVTIRKGEDELVLDFNQ